MDITPKQNLAIRTLAAVVDGLLLLWLWVFVAPALIALAVVVAVFAAGEKLARVVFPVDPRVVNVRGA